MKKYLVLLLIIPILLPAQTYKIEYKSYFESKEQDGQDPLIVYADKQKNYILSEKILVRQKEIPYEVTKVNSTKLTVTNFGFLNDNQVASTISDSLITQYKFELSDETKQILGYTCHKATTVVRSNKMEVWYTTDLNIKGGPSVMGQNLGLVLETVRNGSFAVRASKIQRVSEFSLDKLLENKQITQTDALTYKDLIWKSQFTTIPVLTDAILHFSKTTDTTTAVKQFSHGTVLLRRIAFPKIEDGSSIFVKLTEQSKGDAYDRTGSVFLILEDQKLSFFDALSEGIDRVPAYENGDSKQYRGVAVTADFLPNIELMRFFTPFGIHYFNNVNLKGKKWEDEVNYRQDITDFATAMSGKSCWIGTYIGNYDKNGFKINMEITIHKDQFPRFDTVLPLINTVNVMEMSGQEYGTMFADSSGMTVSFNLDNNIENARIRYIATGHGGWDNGDEFVPKLNTIYVDENKVYAFIPWRTDCGSYRLYNPSSGNFDNGLSSSDYSRSNWCPGTTTNPVYIELGNLKAGKHTLRVQIPQGKREGSSFSFWNVSACLLGNAEKK